MAKELFRAVQAAEEKADLLVQEAQRTARELLKATEAEVTDAEREIALEHRALYQSIIEEKRASMQAAIASNLPAEKHMLEQSLAEARARLDMAAAQIVERIWNDGNR